MALRVSQMKFLVTIAQRNRADLLLTLSVLAIVLAGAVIRLNGLDRTSIWNDEAAAWSMARLPFWNMLRASMADDHPPLYNIILYRTVRLLGDSKLAFAFPQLPWE